MLERKYVFAEGNGQLVYEWIKSLCEVDPQYPEGRVNTLYYETPDFKLYRQKRGSELLKAKFRLRWYQPEFYAAGDQMVRCFLELKRKDGARRHKTRHEVRVRAAELREPYTSEALVNLPGKVQMGAPVDSATLAPLLVVTYFRRRFVGPGRDVRISIDTEIACRSANPNMMRNSAPVRLGGGVLETKCKGEERIDLVRPIRHHLRKTAFSKYASLLEALDQPNGVRL